MLKQAITEVGGRPVILVDSITKVDESDEGAIGVCASHGGRSSGEFALMVPLAAVLFNDAGIGKDEAGIAGLLMLEARGVPAAAVSHETGRIGDAADMWEHGLLSRVNPTAAARGVSPGISVQEAVRRLGEQAGPRDEDGTRGKPLAGM